MMNLAERGMIEALGRRREASLPALAEELAIPPSTAVNVLSRLVSKGLVGRREGESTGRGRPSYLYRIRLPKPMLALYFDGTQLTAGIVADDLSVLAVHSVQVQGIASADAASSLAKEALYSLIGQGVVRREVLQQAAVAVNAMFVKGRPLSSSVLPWAAEDFRQLLDRELGLETRLVALPHALAEYQLLPEPVVDSMLCLNVGDGISGHSMIAGKIATGDSGRSGELGHFTLDPKGPLCGCGRRGCLEAMYGGPAIARRMRDQAMLAGPTWVKQVLDLSPRAMIQRLYQAWCEDDQWSRKLMNDALDGYGWGLGMAINLIDPALVVCSGYVLQGHSQWIEEVQRRCRPWVLHGDHRSMRVVAGRAGMLDHLRVIAWAFDTSEPVNGTSL